MGFLWCSCVLVGASFRLPFVIWQLSNNYGASFTSRVAFFLLGWMINLAPLAILLAMTVTASGLCFVGAQQVTRRFSHRALEGGRTNHRALEGARTRALEQARRRRVLRS